MTFCDFVSGVPSWTRTRYCRFQSNRKAACVKHRSQIHATSKYCIHIVFKWYYSAVVAKHLKLSETLHGYFSAHKNLLNYVKLMLCSFPSSGTTPFLWSHWEYHSARHGGRAAYTTPFERFRCQIIALCHHILEFVFPVYHLFHSYQLPWLTFFRIQSHIGVMFSICQQNVAWAAEIAGNQIQECWEYATCKFPEMDLSAIHCVTPFGVN